MMDAYRILFILLGMITPILFCTLVICILYYSQRCLLLPRFLLESRTTVGVKTERIAEKLEATRNQSIPKHRLEDMQEVETWSYRKIKTNKIYGQNDREHKFIPLHLWVAK